MIRVYVIFLALLISIGTIAKATEPANTRPDDVLTVFDCSFGKDWDNNFDRWPDHWTRESGIEFPQFIEAEIESVPNGKNADEAECESLTVDLNGGAFAAYSPTVEASNHYSYEMEIEVQTSGVKKDRAQISLQFLDEKQRIVREIHSEKIGDTKQKWVQVKIGPIKPNSPKIAWVRVVLATLPGSPEDLSGKIRFTRVWIGRLARLDLKTEQTSEFTGFGIFELGQKISVDCTASGFKSTRPVVRFLLKDIDDQIIQSEEIQLKVSQTDKPHQQLGTASWHPKPSKPGYYRVYASLDNEEVLRCRGETSLAVVESFQWNSESEFGWSFPHGRGPYSLEQLAGLLLRLSCGWVEYPFWYGKSTTEAEIEELLRFVERLSMSGVKLVGLLCDPPPEVRENFGDPPSLSAAEIFTADPELWYPSLETVLLRLGPRIPYWLLGSHEDSSFVNQDHLQGCLSMVMDTIHHAGVDIMLGIPWRWIAAEPQWNNAKGGVPAFLTLTAQPPMTATELQEYSQAFFSPVQGKKVAENTPSNNSSLSTRTIYAINNNVQNDKGESERIPYRVVLGTLGEKQYPPKVRAADLVQRMLAAKQGGASAILISDPFAKGSGIMHEDGSPDVLLLPWRTTTLTFGGSQYLGSMQLPNGSYNRLFSRGEDVVMAVWSDTPREECLFLGEDVKVTDIWGYCHKPETREDKQVIPVDSTPVFVTGLNPMVAMVRMSVQFANIDFPAVLNREYDSRLLFTNTFPGGITGKVHIEMPEGWEVTPNDIAFQLVQNEKLEEPLDVKIPFGALAGKNQIRIDFEVGNRKLYRFSAYRTLQVGSGDIWMEFFPVFDQKGDLTIIQRFVNQTNKVVSFRCQLAVPNRQWSESQIVGMGRGAFEAKHFYPNARDLIGQEVRVRAVEDNGLTTLNYKFIIQ